jgi:hypothetical protein
MGAVHGHISNDKLAFPMNDCCTQIIDRILKESVNRLAHGANFSPMALADVLNSRPIPVNSVVPMLYSDRHHWHAQLSGLSRWHPSPVNPTMRCRCVSVNRLTGLVEAWCAWLFSISGPAITGKPDCRYLIPLRWRSGRVLPIEHLARSQGF